MTIKRFPWFGALALLAALALVSCDIGNWDISRSPESRRNIDAFEEIDFLTGRILSGERSGQFIEGRIAIDAAGNPIFHHGETVRVGVGAYPLAFGVSTQWDSVGIAGGGQQSRRFTDGRSLGFEQQVGANPSIPAAWHNEWGNQRVGPVMLPEASPLRGNPHFRHPVHGDYRVPPTVPPGFIEVAAVSNNRGGKIAGSEDGIAFLFREVSLDRHFVLEADFLIVQYGNVLADGSPQNPGSNGQEGFGIMVRDFVPQIETRNVAGDLVRSGTTMVNFNVNDHRWRLDSDGEGNLVAGMEGGLSHFWAGGPLHGSDSNMIMAGGTKRGMNVKIREGITRAISEHDGLGNPTVPGMQNPIAARFRWWPSPLPDYSFFTEEINGEQVPTFAARPSFPRWGSTVRVRLERTNDGFAYTITNLDDRFDNIDTETGRLIEAGVPKPSVTSAVHGIVRDWDILGMVNDSHYYVGFFAARDATVWVHNIRYFEAYANRTAPARPVLPDLFNPSIDVLSPAFYTGVNTLFLSSNTTGRVSVLQDGERIPDRLITAEWIDARENGTGVPMTLFTVPIREPDEGDTIFTVLFTPGDLPDEHADRNMAHGSNAPIRKTFTMTRRSFDSGETEPSHNGRRASIIFVAPTVGYRTGGGAMGSPLGDGTRGNPLDLQTAINHVRPGQHIVMLDGRYVFDRQLIVPWFNDGTHDARKVLRAESVNGVWLDWDKREDLGPLRGDGSIPADAFLVRGSFWHFDGFHVRGAPDKAKGMTMGGSNNLVTRLSIYNNGDTGFQISFHAAIPTRFWPRDNLVMWTESFHNLDGAQTDADGFGVKLTVGERNLIYSSIAHHNNDDGWDLFSKRESGPIGVTIVDRSIAYRQGWMLNQHRTAAGGIGFKMGGESIGIFHEIRNSLAFGNSTPIGSNSNPNLLIRDSTAIVGDSSVTGQGSNAPGLINITGPAPVAGMAFNSVGTLSRAGFGGGNDGTTNVNVLHDDAITDWRGFMVSRPSSFWGSGDALGDGRAGTQGFVVNSTVGQMVGGHPSLATRMPADYRDWDQFRLFLPRDEYFAYPLPLGDLFRPPVVDGMERGAHRLHDGQGRRNVRHYIPWAVPHPNPDQAWNVRR